MTTVVRAYRFGERYSKESRSHANEISSVLRRGVAESARWPPSSWPEEASEGLGAKAT
jgi:hypothetical protein